jgi:hypothetical protein
MIHLKTTYNISKRHREAFEDEEGNYIYEKHIKEPEEGQQGTQLENLLNDAK